VCSGGGLDREQVADLIGRLVDASILTMAQGGGRGRYRMLETVRLYGAERLREAGEEAELARRHAGWYAELITPGDLPWCGGPRQAGMLDALDAEWANVEAALDFCAGSPAHAELGLRMAADLWLFWLVRGRYQIGRRHLETFLHVAPAPSAARAMALWALGFLAQTTGDHDAALAGFEEARRVSEQTGGDRELAYALFGLGLVRMRLAETGLARELLAASLETMQGVDDPFGRAFGLYFLATAMAAAGRLADARRLALEGLDASEAAGNKFGGGNLDTLLGIVEWLTGDPQAAEAKVKEAVRILDRIGHRWGTAISLQALAWMAGSSSRPERAALLLGASAAVFRELGSAVPPYWRARHDACEAAARKTLGEGRYDACWQEGYALSRDQAAAAALEVQGTVAAARPAPAAAAEEAFELSARELEVARLVADGLSNPAIASALFVSVATVKTHVSHILAKLGLDSRTQLARWVAGHDLGPPAPARGSGPRA